MTKNIGKNIADKYADLMLPEKERLNELEFMINESVKEIISEVVRLMRKHAVPEYRIELVVKELRGEE